MSPFWGVESRSILLFIVKRILLAEHRPLPLSRLWLLPRNCSAKGCCEASMNFVSGSIVGVYFSTVTAAAEIISDIGGSRCSDRSGSTGRPRIGCRVAASLSGLSLWYIFFDDTSSDASKVVFEGGESVCVYTCLVGDFVIFIVCLVAHCSQITWEGDVLRFAESCKGLFDNFILLDCTLVPEARMLVSCNWFWRTYFFPWIMPTISRLNSVTPSVSVELSVFVSSMWVLT